jgi:hypothetical protein
MPYGRRRCIGPSAWLGCGVCVWDRVCRESVPHIRSSTLLYVRAVEERREQKAISHLPVRYSIPHNIHTLHIPVERIVRHDICHEDFVEDSEVFGVEGFAVARYHVLDREGVEGIDWSGHVFLYRL